MKYKVLDIETKPRSIDEIKELKPIFEAPGNIKDPAKIAMAIMHKEQKWVSDAALSPMTGRIYQFGIVGFEKENDVQVFMDDTSLGEDEREKKLLIQLAGHFLFERTLMIGYNIVKFDIPFVATRMRFHGLIQEAVAIMKIYRLDLVEAFTGERYNNFIALNNMLAFFDLPKKIAKDDRLPFEMDRKESVEYQISELNGLDTLVRKYFSADVDDLLKKLQ